MAGLLRALRTALTVVFIVVFGLSVIVTIRTVSLTPRRTIAAPCRPYDTDFIKADPAVLTRFSEALRFQTVAWKPGHYNASELLKMQAWIFKSFPTVHSSPLVTKEVVSNYSLLYKVSGTDTSLRPFLLMAHLDVVPANQDEWAGPAFEGIIDEQFIHGRGTIDDKHAVVGILEAVEFLLKRGHKPRRTFYVAFGHDEEVGGFDGAALIGKLLQQRQVELEFVLDEGTPITIGVMPGVQKPIAMIGCSEKGILTMKMSVRTTGGHSSMPPRETSIGILANAVARLEANPHKSQFGNGPERGLMEHLAHEMAPLHRVLMSNLWLFSPIVAWVMSKKPESNVFVRTTTAVTMFNAGVKSNVLTPYAEAVVNHRIHPAQTVSEIIAYDKKIVNDDRVVFEVIDSMEPHKMSPYDKDNFGFQTIKTSIEQVWAEQNVTVAPGVMIANTDTKHYLSLTQNIYRFSASYLYREDLPRFHGKDERISVRNYQQVVNFFYHVIVNADKGQSATVHRHSSEL